MAAWHSNSSLSTICNVAALIFLVTGCSEGPSSTATDPAWATGIEVSGPRPEDIVFKDDVTSNAEVPDGLDDLVFLDTEGNKVAMANYVGSKNIVLVFTQGFAGGMLCPFCKTQTSRLVANYDKFTALNAEVLVVYPGTRDHLEEFITAAKTHEKREVDKVPFPLLLDEKLTAVNFFNIASNLAHPSTFIIDTNGDVKLAYVGADMSADRPSVAAILKTLAEAQPEDAAAE